MSVGGHVIRNRVGPQAGVDLNNLLIPGDYALSSPSNGPGGALLIVYVRVYDPSGANRFVHQLAFSIEGDDPFIRYYDGAWSAWTGLGSGGGGGANLSTTRDAVSVTVVSDSGSDAVIPAADTDLAGVMTADMFDKLAGIEAGATNYVDEEAQDAVGLILDDGTIADIDFEYDDATPFIAGTIKAGAVTLGKIQSIDSQRFLGRNTAGTGVVEQITKTIAKTILAWFTWSATAPSSPDPGDAWLDDDTGILFERFTDADSSQWVEWGSGYGSATVGDGTVTYAKIQNVAGLSVIGRATNSTGVTDAISAANDGEVLRRSGTSIGFGTVATAGIGDSQVTLAKIQNIATARLLGRSTAGSGVVEELTEANARTILGYVRPDVTNNFTVGYTATEFDNGTVSSGTLTPTPVNGNTQKYTNNGAHTLAPPSVAGSYTITIDVTNGASAGTITTSSWTKVTGDPFTTTNGHKFRLYCSKGQTGTHMYVQAMQ